MKFQELLQDPIFQLPLQQPSDTSFDAFIEEYLNRFLAKVNLFDEEEIKIHNHSSVRAEKIKKVQTNVVRGLIKTIQDYYNGAPFTAYQTLASTIISDDKDLYAIVNQISYPVGESFYRIRLKEDNFPFEGHEMFHIPFEQRGKVVTQRFSIPGFPSLYLGRCLYVCWEELMRPSLDNFQVVRLQSTRSLKVLDLTPPRTTGPEAKGAAYRYFMTFPLIACCSVKVREPNDTFKPEYIIPKLLLQWVRKNDAVDGIRYNSTHIDPSFYKEDNELVNLVLPVKENQPHGYCPHLQSMFEITETISWQLRQFALGEGTFMYFREEMEYLNKKVPSLELVRGRKYPYSHSILGKLEMLLDGMGTRPLQRL